MRYGIIFVIAVIAVVWWQEVRTKRSYTFPTHYGSHHPSYDELLDESITNGYGNGHTYDELYDAHLSNEADY